jgi:hypothetical protein
LLKRLLSGGEVTVEVWQQLQYADMLIDVSQNWCSNWCNRVEKVDENTIRLGFPYLKYLSQSNHNEALEWLYLGMFVSSEVTILSSIYESINRWNEIAQKMNNTSEEHKLMSKDSFEK